MTVKATRDTLAAGARPSDQPAPPYTIVAVINYAIELGTNRPDVKSVAATLADFAQSGHELLRAARSELTARLHHRSDNLGATRGLRVAEEALRVLCYPPVRLAWATRTVPIPSSREPSWR
jgi:hypothetical protein